MTKQFRSIAFAACIAPLLPIGMPTAQAKQCSVALPSNPQGHWSYRIIDGRRCWYEGNNMLSKSLLQRPAEASAQPDSGAGPASFLTEKPDNPVDPDVCCWPPLNNADNFETRWRALDAMGKY
jgi:hypothetical protein